jgi:Tfp pilus assembly protein PilF
MPSWIVLIVVAVAPFLFATAFSGYEVVKQYLLSAGAGLALIGWGIGMWRRGRGAIVAGRVTLLALSFGLYVVLSIAWGSRPLYAAVEAIPMVSLMALVFVVSAPLGRRIRFFDLALAISVGAGASGLAGLLDAVGVGVFTTVWDPPGATGTFDAMEFATAYYAVAIPITIGALLRFEGRSRYTFATCFLLAALHFGCVADWWAMGALVGAGLAAALLVLAYEGTSTVLGLYPAAVLLGVVLLFKVVAFQALGYPEETSDATSLPVVDTRAVTVEERLEGGRLRIPVFSTGRMESVRSMETRRYLAAVGFELIQERPLIGRGPGAWWTLQTKHPQMDHPAVEKQFRTYPAFRSAHNGWIETWVEYGGIGLALLSLWLTGSAAVGLGALGREEDYPEIVAEQWGFWTTAIAGVVFATLTPLLELAPAAAVWVAVVAFMTIRSAEINHYEGASVRWSWGEDGGLGGVGRVLAAGLPLALGAAMIAGSTVDTVSKLHRGYGDHLMLRTYYERAIASYEEANRWFPERGDVLYNIATARWQVGDLSETKETLERALEMRPYDSRVLTLMARYHLDQRNNERALKTAQQAVNRHPNGVGARRVLVRALYGTSQIEKAATQLQEMLERDPPDAERASLHFLLAQLYAGALEEYGHAEEHYESAREYATSSSILKQVEKGLKKLEEKKKKQDQKTGESKERPPGFPQQPPGRLQRGPGGDSKEDSSN